MPATFGSFSELVASCFTRQEHIQAHSQSQSSEEAKEFWGDGVAWDQEQIIWEGAAVRV